MIRNSAKLAILLDLEPPVVDFCQSPPVFVLNPGQTLATDVEWDEPVFHDNSLTPLNVSRTADLGSDFPIGVTNVTYLARDLAGNKALCVITIQVEGKKNFAVFHLAFQRVTLRAFKAKYLANHLKARIPVHLHKDQMPVKYT